MSNVIWTRGTSQDFLATELNSLANNSNALGSAITLTNTGFMLAQFELVVSFGTAPTANTCLLLWLLQEIDGANYEDGGSSVTPGRNPDLIFPLRAVTGNQRIIQRLMLAPPAGNLRALLRNDGTGQALAASGNTLKGRFFTESF